MMKSSLKTASFSLATAILALAQGAVAQNTNTNVYNTNLFAVTFRGVCTSTNASGLVHEQVLNANLLGDCAADHNITNLNSLTLVFNRTNYSLQVVDTNGVAVCTALTFTGTGGLTFTNTNNTSIVFQRNVLFGTNLTSSGVIFGSATWSSNPTNLASSFSLRADILYTEPAVGTNSAYICRAVLLAGRAAQQEEDEDNFPGHGRGPGHNNGNHYGWDVPSNPHSGGDGNNGNNGNHFGWNNPNNPHNNNNNNSRGRR